jgi:hypothetical protein
MTSRAATEDRLWGSERDRLDFREGALREAKATQAELASEKQRAVSDLAHFDALFPLALVASLAMQTPASASGVLGIPREWVEYLATILLERPSSAAVRGDTDDSHSPPAARRAAESALARIRSIAGRSAFAAMVESATATGPKQGLAADQRHRDLTWRWPSYPEQETDLIGEIFDPEVGRALASRLGFDAPDALVLLDAVGQILGLQLEHHQAEAAQRFGELASPALREELGVGKDAQLMESQLRTAMALGPDLVDVLLFDAARLARHSGLAEEAVAVFLDLFSCQFGSTRGTAGLSGQSTIRHRPFVEIGDGLYLLTSFGNLHYAIRPALEDALGEGEEFQAFQIKRAAAVESHAATSLRRTLGPQAGIYSNLRFDLDGHRNLEVDILVLIDDLALVVEAKGGTLGSNARSGKPAPLSRTVQSVIGKGIEQSTRLARALAEDKPVQFRDHSSNAPVDIDLDPIQRAQAIVVTLEDLSWLASRRGTLRELGAATAAGVDSPWVVSVFDLDLITRMCRHAAELTLYSALRPDLDPRVLAYDELEIWLTYLNESLNFSGVTGKPIIVDGRVDALDDVYIRREGHLPHMDYPKPVKRELRRLEKKSQPGWLARSEELIAEAQLGRTPASVAGPVGVAISAPPGRGVLQRIVGGEAGPLPQIHTS